MSSLYYVLMYFNAGELVAGELLAWAMIGIMLPPCGLVAAQVLLSLLYEL